MKFHALVALPLLLLLSFADFGKSCDYSKTLSCCGTHVNFIINSYKINNLYITINPAKRARDICCHMKHVERCLLVERDCKPFYNTFVYNLYNNLQQHDVDCVYYKQHFCPGLLPATHTTLNINLLGSGPKPQRPLVKYPEEATIVVNAIVDTVKTALDNATQERPTTIYADTVTEPGLVVEQTTPIPELSFGEDTLTDCDYDGTTPMPDVVVDVIQVGANSVNQETTEGSVDTPVLERPTKCNKSRFPVEVDNVPTPKIVPPKPVPAQQPAKTDCSNTDDIETTGEKPIAEDGGVKDSKYNKVNYTTAEKVPKTGGCRNKDEKNANSSERAPTEPSSNEENPSEPESSPSPAESGEVQPETAAKQDAGSSGKTTDNAESGEENPTNVESGELSPTNAGSGEQSPSNTESGEQSPNNAGSKEQSPGNTESGEQSPNNAGSKEQSPGNTESGEQSPNNAGSKEQSPGNTESGEQSPNNAGSKEQSPGNTESGEQSPNNAGSKEQSPGNTESGEQSPTKAGGSGEQGQKTADDKSAEENPKGETSGEQTHGAKESGEEEPATACSSQAQGQTNSGEEGQGNVVSNAKEVSKPCKDAKQPGPGGNIDTNPPDSEERGEKGSPPTPKAIGKQISPEEKQRACCLGTYLKPCTTVTSKCYQLYLALHSFLDKYDCLSCVSMEVVHDGCHQREVVPPPTPKPAAPTAADSSEEETRPLVIPKPFVRPAAKLPKVKLPRLPQYPLKVQRGKQQQPIRKKAKQESSEEMDDYWELQSDYEIIGVEAATTPVPRIVCQTGSSYFRAFCKIPRNNKRLEIENGHSKVPRLGRGSGGRHRTGPARSRQNPARTGRRSSTSLVPPGHPFRIGVPAFRHHCVTRLFR